MNEFSFIVVCESYVLQTFLMPELALVRCNRQNRLQFFTPISSHVINLLIKEISLS